MSYDLLPSGLREEYYFGGAEAFGVTSITHNIIGPKGCVGFVRDISVDLTVASSTTGAAVPEIDVGIASGDFTFGRYRLGTSATAGYAIGMHRAGNELLTGLPPRALNDFPGHVVLDGGPLGNVTTTPGGSSSTQAPLGRIPAGGYTVTNVVSGTGTADRIFVQQPLDTFLQVGQTVSIQGVNGVNASINAVTTITALSLTGGWIEVLTGSFTGTYTSGGIVDIVAIVTEKQGSATATATGIVKVTIDWLGNTW